MKATKGSAIADRSGSAAIEFAFVSPILIFLLLAVLQFGINYMETSAVQNGAFLLARAIQSATTPPTDVASAKAIILSANMVTQKNADLIVSVSALPTTAMTSMPTQPTSDSFSLPASRQPALIRVVAKRTNLLPLQLLVPTFWSDLIGAKIDYSVVTVVR
jgi:Flp pilus assembly protein TadG